MGLITNIALNLWWLPLWGLQGAVLATLFANAVVLLGIWLAMNRHGYRLDETAFYATIMPATNGMPSRVIVCKTNSIGLTSIVSSNTAVGGYTFDQNRIDAGVTIAARRLDVAVSATE